MSRYPEEDQEFFRIYTGRSGSTDACHRPFSLQSGDSFEALRGMILFAEGDAQGREAEAGFERRETRLIGYIRMSDSITAFQRSTQAEELEKITLRICKH